MGKVVLGRRLFLLGSASVLLTGCVQTKEEKQVEQETLASMAEYLVANHDRVAGFSQEPAYRLDGFSQLLTLKIFVTGEKPVTAPELDALLKDVWALAPKEPNAIVVSARDSTTKETPVDVFAAAKKLDGLRTGPYGFGGVHILDMATRYGERETPVAKR